MKICGTRTSRWAIEHIGCGHPVDVHTRTDQGTMLCGTCGRDCGFAAAGVDEGIAFYPMDRAIGRNEKPLEAFA